MFGIGLTEIIIILVVALLVVGPKKLPELAKTLGRGLAEFRRTADDFKESIYQDEDSSASDRQKSEPQRQISKIQYPASRVKIKGLKTILPKIEVRARTQNPDHEFQ